VTPGPSGEQARPRVWAPIAAVVFGIVLGGCSARATVRVSMRPDGSGTVQAAVVLDADAVQAAEAGGATLQQRVRLADLHAAGWTVSPWVASKSGGATLTVTKRFQSPGQVARIARELAGTTGPLRSFAAARDAAWVGLGHRVTLRGTVDLTAAQPGVTTDQQLVASLAGQHVDVNAINLQLLAQLRSSLSVRVVADLPGSRRTITIQPGNRQQLDVAATTIDPVRGVLLGVAVALAFLAAVVWRRGGRRRAPRRRPRATTTVGA
jgi:hypothetical protein